MPAKRQFEVVLEAQDEGGYAVSVPDLPGLWTQADTREDAIANAKDAIAGYLETLEELGRPIPKPRRERLTIEA
jgi:predicted RNase H-like HicB family nuclease